MEQDSITGIENSATEPPVYLHLSDNKIIISFKPSAFLKAKLKQVPGAKLNNNLMRYEAPLASYDVISNIFDNLVLSESVMRRLRDDAEIKDKVEVLKKVEWYEIEDYIPKLPIYAHQKKAFQLHRLLSGSADFSEVGCGKTVPAICAIHWRKLIGDIKSCLIISPLSLIRNWQEELSKFSDLTCIPVIAPGKEQRLKRLQQERDVYLINLDYVDTLQEELLNKKFDMVIVDEAHRIKNPQALQSKATYRLGDSAKFRIALTGSPVLNSVMDCFGTMRFVNSSIFGESFYSFRNKYFINLAKDGSPFPMYVPKKGAEKEISDKMYSCSIRFLKSECLELPEFTTIDRVVTLSTEQDRAYRQMQEDLMVELSNLEVVKVNHVLTMLMKLNQITSGWLKKPKEDEIIFFEKNPKFEELKTVIEELQQKPAIIWAYYKADMALINNYYTHCRKCKESTRLIPGNNCLKCGEEVKYRVSVVQGSTKNRNAEIAWFKYTPTERAAMRKTMVEAGISEREIRSNLGDLLSDGTEPLQTNLFIGQISAASEGLTLNQALYSIYFSRDYSLKNHIQSLGRNHRAGQKEKVTYINLVCCRRDGEDTVDMRILNKLKKKEDLAQRINKDDLKFLFGDFKKKDREAFKDIEVVADSNPDASTEVQEESKILLDTLVGDPQPLFENIENISNSVNQEILQKEEYNVNNNDNGI